MRKLLCAFLAFALVLTVLAACRNAVDEKETDEKNTTGAETTAKESDEEDTSGDETAPEETTAEKITDSDKTETEETTNPPTSETEDGGDTEKEDYSKMKFTVTYPDYNLKAFTVSYDDGTIQDKRVMALARRYGIGVTFAPNTGVVPNGTWWGSSGWMEHEGYTVWVQRPTKEEIPTFYDDFEIASHTATHIDITKASDSVMKAEVVDAMNYMNKLTGHKIVGMCYPGNWYDDASIKKLQSYGIIYGRSAAVNYGFELPSDFMVWIPTAHDADAKVPGLADQYLKKSTDRLLCFYIWGHAYELDKPSLISGTTRWGNLEALFKKMGTSGTVWCATNGEIAAYVLAVRECKQTSEYFKNNSKETVFAVHGDYKLAIGPGEKYMIKTGTLVKTDGTSVSVKTINAEGPKPYSASEKEYYCYNPRIENVYRKNDSTVLFTLDTDVKDPDGNLNKHIYISTEEGGKPIAYAVSTDCYEQSNSLSHTWSADFDVKLPETFWLCFEEISGEGDGDGDLGTVLCDVTGLGLYAKTKKADGTRVAAYKNGSKVIEAYAWTDINIDYRNGSKVTYFLPDSSKDVMLMHADEQSVLLAAFSGPGAYAEYKFTGTAVNVYNTVENDSVTNDLKIYVDGELIATVDDRHAFSITKDGLSAGEHTVKLLAGDNSTSESASQANPVANKDMFYLSGIRIN